MKPETLAEARAWDTRRDAYVASGLSPREAASRAWSDQEPKPDRKGNAALLRMLFKDSDAKIARDLDCYPCGACHKPSCFVCKYAKARKKATGFSARNFARNNHKNIPELVLQQVQTLADPPKDTRYRRVCARSNCQRVLTSVRSDARFCSPRCQRAAHRAA